MKVTKPKTVKVGAPAAKKPKVATPAKKAAMPAIAKPAAGRKPPTVREAMTPKKEAADNLGDGEQSWFVRYPAGRVIREPERAQTLLSVETKHIASLLTE